MKNSYKYLVALLAVMAVPSLAQAHCGGCEAKTAAATTECSGDCAKACCADAGAQTAELNAESAKKAKMAFAQYKVEGMTCGACEGKVTKALTAINGVSKTKSCAESKLTKVMYDPKKIKPTELYAALQKTGFKVQGQMVELKVDGMTCGGCSSKVSKALASIDGVKEQSVCHESKHAVVTFDPKKVSDQQIVAAIDKTGFKVVQ